MLYPNNGYYSYVNEVSRQYNFPETDSFLLKVFKTLPIIVWRTVRDTGIELFFLLIFWVILVKMSQGRDLIVSIFEPDGLYGTTRIVFTTLAVISFSISMWIIPAFLFHQRELWTKKDLQPRLPFQEHLFFMHRILPLVPFWLVAAVLFNGNVMVFVAASVAELALLSWFNQRARSEATRKWIVIIVSGLLLALTAYFFWKFQRVYTEMKIILAINLYLLSVLMYFLFYEADNAVLKQHASGLKKGQSLFRKYDFNSMLYLFFFLVHIALVLLIYYDPVKISFAPESLLLYMFSVYVFAIDLFFYIINVSRISRLIAAVGIVLLLMLLASPVWNINVSHFTMDRNSDSTYFSGRDRDSFADRYAVLRDQIIQNTSDEPYPIVLISGEGGGSRAGLWFSQNLINFDFDTKGKFRKHIFSISTVSGSSVGLGTVFTFWDKTRDDTTIDRRWTDIPGDVFANNYVGTSIRGLLLVDLYKSLVPGKWENDRNTMLQIEEAGSTERAVLEKFDPSYENVPIPDSLRTLKKDFMYFFYEKRDGKLQYRKNTPITLINTCRSNDGRRGMFSSIKLSDSYFNDAIDIAGYLYEDSVCADNGTRLCKGIRKPISLGQACNTSELFPVFSAPAYIDSLGSFVDGGYHENSGLKSTLDVYQQLRRKLEKENLNGKKYKIYILYLKNGSAEKHLYKKIASEPTFMQPINALFSQPFEGSASYFEEKAKFVSASDDNAVFVPVNLNPKYLVDPELEGVQNNDPRKKLEKEILKDLMNPNTINRDGIKDTILNFPLARWLSRTIINRIEMCAAAPNRNPDMEQLLKSIRKLNNVATPTDSVYKKYPVHYQLKNAGDSASDQRMLEQDAYKNF